MQALRKLARYIKGTLHYKLNIRPAVVVDRHNTDLKIEAYTDADWAGQSDRHSITGGLLMLDGVNVFFLERPFFFSDHRLQELQNEVNDSRDFRDAEVVQWLDDTSWNFAFSQSLCRRVQSPSSDMQKLTRQGLSMHNTDMRCRRRITVLLGWCQCFFLHGHRKRLQRPAENQSSML